MSAKVACDFPLRPRRCRRRRRARRDARFLRGAAGRDVSTGRRTHDAALVEYEMGCGQEIDPTRLPVGLIPAGCVDLYIKQRARVLVRSCSESRERPSYWDRIESEVI